MKKIVLCGIQSQGIDIIDFLYKKGIKITNIVTISEDLAIKNKSESSWVSYEEISKKYNIPIYYAKSYNLKDKSDIDFFIENKFYILLLGGWQRLISKNILKNIKFPIGQHGSPDPLPKGRGRSPVNWSILKNKKRLVWNLFLLDENIDSGDVIDTEIFDINKFDDCETLYFKISISVKYMLLRTIPKLIKSEDIRKKQIGNPTYYLKRTEKDGKIDWNNSINDIYNLVRSVTKPYPGAYTDYNGIKIKIWKCQIFDTKLNFYFDREYGEIIEIFNDNKFLINCSEGLLLVTDHEDNDIFVGKKYK